MQPLETMLSRSIQHYRGVLQLLERIDRELGTADPQALAEFSRALELMQTEASPLDREIAAQFQAQPRSGEQIATLAGERNELIGAALAINQRISAKALGVKSLLSHEMGKLRTGLTALSGYRQPQPHRGRITNCSS